MAFSAQARSFVTAAQLSMMDEDVLVEFGHVDAGVALGRERWWRQQSVVDGAFEQFH